MAASGVEVVWPALSRAWRKAEYEELWLQFRPRGSKDVFAAVQAAVDVANQAMEDAGWGDVVFAEGVSDSDAGPVALMSRAGPEDGVRAWLDAFAHHLEALGESGKVTAAPEAKFPAWLNGEIRLPPQLTAFVSYRTVDLTPFSEPERRAGWHVPADVTAKIAETAVAWGRFDGADVYLRRNIHEVCTKNPDISRPLADGITRFGLAGVSYLRSQPRRMTMVSLATQGQVCYELLDETLSWQARFKRVGQAMVALPDDTDLAFVQYSNAYTISWNVLQTAVPRLPYVQEYHVRYNRHLLSQYTPDAHGVQVLTDAHLQNAADLSDWLITPLSGGRHLVHAKDLEPWYAQVEPDAATLQKARADFGPMILTPETIARHPPPWS